MAAQITEEQKILRHSAAHLLAHAVKELYPDTLLTIGPATEEGFFYDFLPQTNFKLEDLPAIETRMKELAEKNYALTHKEIDKEEARKLYHNNPFKLELINGIPGDTVGLSCQGDFYDLCRGGHEKSTGSLKHVKLTAISGAYWRADRSKQPLQRISGVVFPTAKELRIYEQKKEEALKYDHRKLGKQLDLFSFHEEGVGFPFFHPKGFLVVRLLINYLRNLLEKAGYHEISTPVMLTDDLWRQSGHYQHYKDNMYFSIIDEKHYAIKPMNCPGSILVYRERPHSYRELPLRLAEFGKVHRYELSGVLHGLFRARAFTIDDAHVYCTPEQIESEVQAMVRMTFQVLNKFGFDDINVAVSTKPDNAMGDDLLWDKATKALEHALDKEKIPYVIQPGEGAFYGPKIEFMIKDSMGRQWQCGTVQIDFFQPENFDLTYIAPSGKKERPVMIHRAIYGSLERFLGILLEHYKGKLPFWIAPVQARVLTITDAFNEYAQNVHSALQKAGIRAEIDTSSDKINAQIKAAQLDQIPWMIVVGQKESENNTVTLRHRDGKQEFGLSIDQLIERAQELS